MKNRARVKVLESFRTPRATTNPYLTLLLASLRDEGVDVTTFSWPRALLARYDVLHLHWPELLLRGSDRRRTVVRQVLFALLLARVAITRTAVVRTVHNSEPHECGAAVERLLLAACDRATTLGVHLVEATRSGRWREREGIVVPHGHYRDWYRSRPEVHPEIGRVLHVGLLRPYKNVEALLQAATGTDGSVHVRIAGRPTTPELADLVARAASGPEVSALLRHLDDDEIVQEVSRAALVVLPYASSHNSGAALLALSLDRPVLVPRTAVTDALAREVGESWVMRYDGPLTSAHLEESARRAVALQGRPDLSAREWRAAAAAHRTAFGRAARRAQSRRRWGGFTRGLGHDHPDQVKDVWLATDAPS